MLCKDPFIIDPKTFSLIQELQSLEIFKDFYLLIWEITWAIRLTSPIYTFSWLLPLSF